MAATVAALMPASLPALADTFDLSFGTTADAFNGSAVLTGTLIIPGEYQITAVTGTTDTGNGVDRPIFGIEVPYTFEQNDNLLLESAAGVFSLDPSGLSYSLKDGAQINVFQGEFFGPTEILERANGKFVDELVPYSISVAQTPEPRSFALLGTGLLGVVGVLRKRLAA